MIKLDAMELEATSGKANSVAQLLVKKAIEEEMKARPFTAEEEKELTEVKKNVEIEYFLNLLAKDKITVSDVEILELYKKNIATLKDKNVIDIFPQLQQVIYNQKLGAEKAAIVNKLVDKYDLNDILKEYVPEVAKMAAEAAAKKAAEESNAEKVQDKEDLGTSVFDAKKDEVRSEHKDERIPEEKLERQIEKIEKETDKIIPIHEAKETIKEIKNEALYEAKKISDETSDFFSAPKKESVSQEYNDIPEKKKIAEPVYSSEEKIHEFVSQPVMSIPDEMGEETGPGPFVAETPVTHEDTFTENSEPEFKEPVSHSFMKEEDNDPAPVQDIFSTDEPIAHEDPLDKQPDFFEAPKVVFDDDGVDSSATDDTKQQTVEIVEKKDDEDVPNGPFGFNNFNFKFD